MSTPAFTDQEFIAAFRKLPSPSKLAKQLGVSEREVHKRRRRVEQRHGITLNVSGDTVRTHVPKVGAENKLEVSDGIVIVFGDVHKWPGEEPSLAERALFEVIKAEKKRIKACILNGDLFDGARCSRHGPTEWMHLPDVKDEIEACQDFMARLEEKLPRETPLLWNMGNHDSRFSVRIATQASEMAGVHGMDLRDHFNPDWQIAWSTMVNSNTLIKHRFSGGLHATYNNALKSGVNCVTGHLHQLRVTPMTDVNGRRYGVDAGTLSNFIGEKKFSYVENNPLNWGQGFAVLDYTDWGLLKPPLLCEVLHDTAWYRGQAVLAK